MAASIVVPAISALIPLVAQYIVPMLERVFGGKKAPTDIQTGATKQDQAVAILQQLAASLGVSATTEEYRKLVDDVVAVMNANGTLPKPNAPVPIGTTFTFTGTLTAK